MGRHTIIRWSEHTNSRIGEVSCFKHCCCVCRNSWGKCSNYSPGGAALSCCFFRLNSSSCMRVCVQQASTTASAVKQHTHSVQLGFELWCCRHGQVSSYTTGPEEVLTFFLPASASSFLLNVPALLMFRVAVLLLLSSRQLVWRCAAVLPAS